MIRRRPGRGVRRREEIVNLGLWRAILEATRQLLHAIQHDGIRNFVGRPMQRVEAVVKDDHVELVARGHLRERPFGHIATDEMDGVKHIDFLLQHLRNQGAAVAHRDGVAIDQHLRPIWVVDLWNVKRPALARDRATGELGLRLALRDVVKRRAEYLHSANRHRHVLRLRVRVAADPHRLGVRNELHEAGLAGNIINVERCQSSADRDGDGIGRVELWLLATVQGSTGHQDIVHHGVYLARPIWIVPVVEKEGEAVILIALLSHRREDGILHQRIE